MTMRKAAAITVNVVFMLATAVFARLMRHNTMFVFGMGAVCTIFVDRIIFLVRGDAA